MCTQEQVYMKIACPGVVQTLATTPNTVYCAAAIAEKIHIWEVSTKTHVIEPVEYPCHTGVNRASAGSCIPTLSASVCTGVQ